MIILGYDHRHNSKLFAHSAAQVYTAYGHRVRVFPKIVPTPFVPSAVQCLGDGEVVGLAVMVTASHNPRKDNGYKVYGGNGAQIGDKVAKEILEFIKRERINYKKLNTGDFVAEDDQELLEMVMKWYVNNLKSFMNGLPKSLNMPRVVYTALHGVGAEYVDKVFEEIFGNQALIHVPEQKDPDADFPTVDFPNPEEGRSTLSLAMKLAEAESVKYIFANDPDADRFCVAEFTGCADEEWKIFNGNEIAVLLADFISVNKEGKCAMLASCVSSRFLKTFCENRGWIFESTSTGFKNLGNRGLELKGKEGIRVLLAYEEAIGFQVGDWNFDKDGISSLITFYALLQNNENCSLSERLRLIYEREKCWPVQCNGYYFCRPANRIKTILQAIDTEKLKKLTKSFKNENGVVTVEFDVEGFGEAWLMLRSSGTEPKLKYYSELIGMSEKIGSEAALEGAVDELIELMISPDINNLIKKK